MIDPLLHMPPTLLVPRDAARNHFRLLFFGRPIRLRARGSVPVVGATLDGANMARVFSRVRG